MDRKVFQDGGGHGRLPPPALGGPLKTCFLSGWGLCVQVPGLACSRLVFYCAYPPSHKSVAARFPTNFFGIVPTPCRFLWHRRLFFSAWRLPRVFCSLGCASLAHAVRHPLAAGSRTALGFDFCLEFERSMPTPGIAAFLFKFLRYPPWPHHSYSPLFYLRKLPNPHIRYPQNRPKSCLLF